MSWRRADKADDGLGRATSEVGASGVGAIKVQPRLEPEWLDPREAMEGAFPTLENMLPELRDMAGEGVLNRGNGRLLTGERCCCCTGGSRKSPGF